MRFAPLSIAALTATLTFSSGAFPGAAPRTRTASRTTTAMSGALGKSLGPAALRYGVSLGSPTEGHLIGGAHLETTPYLRVEPVDEAGDVRWGLEPLVRMIDRAARAVRRQYPDAITSVGHLSREGGGDVDRHRSHESGRDADIGFFVKSASGRQLLASHFVQFRGDGTAPSWPGAYFDDARNWVLVASLVTDPEAHVTHLFVAAPLRARLLAYAERTGVPASLRMRAAEVLQQPHGALPHDDHFHVRIGCPAHMSGCVENPAVRWRPAATSLVAHGRRGAPTHAGAPAAGLVTPAPTHAPLPSLPSPGPASTPPRPDAEPAEPSDAPPASMPAPIDDVDG